jgi:di/tricarboxylate transporter
VYHAAVIAVARGDQRLNQKIGDIILRPGDTLLLEAHPDFARDHRNSRDFYLVSLVEDSAPPGLDKAWIALAILLAMVLAVTLGGVSMLAGALVAAVLMVITGCCNTADAMKSVDWQVLVVIGLALGLGNAVQASTLASSLASGLMTLVGDHPWAVLAMVYLITLILTELVTNNAAAVLVFPIAMAAADRLGVGIMPFVMAVMIGASAGFATPLGYQTHMMVYSPGGYRFSDYLKVGIPLDILIGVTAITIIPWVWGW